MTPGLKWSTFKRSRDEILAVWPLFKPLRGRWFMQELVDRGNLTPSWRERLIEGENDSVRSDHYPDRNAALARADALNPILRKASQQRQQEPTSLRSLELKIDKALQAKKRLEEEEALMLAEAIRRHQGHDAPGPAMFELAPEAEAYRQDLVDQPYRAGEKEALISERAKIANGFGLSATTHWGKTKARIREFLLPRANQLLQLASVRRLLAEAFARGERVLVSNGIVFWYEEDGAIGWQVKEAAVTAASDGATIWKEGTIRSTNHGRLVILPYMKDDGETVRGHTKNGPRDGKALPRHPDHYVDIPFSLYEGDLMIGLFGELPYE